MPIEVVDLVDRMAEDENHNSHALGVTLHDFSYVYPDDSDTTYILDEPPSDDNDIHDDSNPDLVDQSHDVDSHDDSIPDRIDRYVADYDTEELGSTPTSPASEFLFDVNPHAKPLSEKDRKIFYSVFARLLYVGKRTWPDLQVAVDFLGTRTLRADADDWKKLKRLLAYIKGTLNDKLILRSDDTNIVKWWTDASYGVHEDMKSHTGGVMTLGSGAIYATSCKQRLNTVSSTESELVATSDVLHQALWTSYFLKSQNVIVDESVRSG